MERAEAEAIYEQGREVVVRVLVELSAQNERLTAQVEALTARVAKQEERIAQLERKAKRSSRDSSQPPSQDPPGTPPRRGKDPSGRKQGAQPGHEGKGRPLLPAWAVDEFVDHWPRACGCGHLFGERELVADGEPARHQVEELPPIQVVVTEHRCQRVRCPDCGARPRGELPAGIGHSSFGPRYHAAVAVLSVRNRISRRDVVECCEQLFGSRISSGTIDAILTRVADTLEDPVADLGERVRGAAALHADETGWRTAGDRRALWGAFTARHAVLKVASDRGEEHAKNLLGDTRAIVTSDRLWAYGHLPVRRRQICWAHLRRDFTAHADGLGAEKEFGEAALQICEQLFWTWETFQHTGDRRELKRRVRALQREFKPTLHLRGQGAALPLHARAGTQPAQGLAGTVDLRQPRRRRADQQPRRTRPTRRGHLPQALARHPVRRRRTAHRPTAVRPHHLPPATPQPPRLPHRRAPRPQPRRPRAATRLTSSAH